MSQLAELHLLKSRISDLEETVEIIDKGFKKHQQKLQHQIYADLVVKFASYQFEPNTAPGIELREAILRSARAWAADAVRGLE